MVFRPGWRHAVPPGGIAIDHIPGGHEVKWYKGEGATSGWRLEPKAVDTAPLLDTSMPADSLPITKIWVPEGSLARFLEVHF